MRFLVALALLALGVAYAHHTPEHRLGYPGFLIDKIQLYDVTINMTSGVPGLHSQVSKAVIKSELRVYSPKESEIYIQMHKVLVSDSLAGVESHTERVHLKSKKALEDLLKIPIKAVFENGMVKRYTLSHLETLESQKIKRTILRNLEIYLDRKYLHGGNQQSWPISYNASKTSPAGSYYSHYVVTSSPYVSFPKELNVFNISRTDNFEVIPYLAYMSHNNFEKQGCPEVCKMNHIENRYGAGCPIQHEPYHTPLKRSFVQQHNLRKLQSGTTIIDSVSTKETHVADVYDQNMEIVIKTELNFLKAINGKISEPVDQTSFTDLNDFNQEINEPEIQSLCRQPSRVSAVEKARKVLTQILEIVLRGDIEGEPSKQIGELLISLQKSLQLLTQEDLRKIQKDIVSYEELSNASEQDKVKRQIWLDMLPVIGTSESISYIVHFITENINSPHKQISLWESRSILESLPPNIHEASEKTITELSSLLEILSNKSAPGHSIFYSAAHLAVARVIRSLCTENVAVPSSDEPRETMWKSQRSEKSSEYYQNMSRKCPKVIVKKFIEKIIRQLQMTHDKSKRVIYIETLARTGLDEVLPVLKPYIYGEISGPVKSSRSEPARELSKSYIDYLKTVTLYALYNIVEKSPRAVQDLVLPVFLNKTEPPKVRIAAFGVVAKSQPTLGILHLIAKESWQEPSEEVGSFVTSTLENFANSTLPCNQLTASRIKKVLPQVKRVDRGYQKAKNYLWDLWDEVRGFGLEKQFEFTPSNESFFPSALYGSLGYNVDTFKDVLFQYAFNAQGFTSRNLYEKLLIALGLRPADDIPKESENAIFPDMDISARDTDFWKFILYNKLFYATSYYYFDGEDVSKESLLDILVDQLRRYISIDSQGHYRAHFVKVALPSSYHIKSVVQTLPYPVQFEISNPSLVSVKMKVHPLVGQERSEGSGYQIHLHPSMYYATFHTNEILNLGDCKKIGVYHEQNSATTYPVVLSFSTQNSNNISWSYQFPDLPKKIFTFQSEAGTYAGEKHLEILPPKEVRRTIKTLPSTFTKRLTFGVIGLPKFNLTINTEDIQFGYAPLSRNAKEATIEIFRRQMNGGWRRKTVDILRVPDSVIWKPKTEVKFTMDYSRDYASVAEGKASESDWTKDLKFDDALESQDSSSYASEGQSIYNTFVRKLNHIKDTIKVRVEQRVKSATVNKAYLNLEYYHTLGGFLHLVHFNASASIPKIFAPITVAADYAIAFANRPNDFKYSDQYGKQQGLALGAISFSKSSPFLHPSVIAKAIFKYKPLSEVLHMNTPVPEIYFEPETHEQCLKDIQEGETLSVACVKAIREKSIYNYLKMHAVLPEELPELVREFTEKFDLALKHTYFSHMEITKKTIEPLTTKASSKSLYLEATYIDKMTPEPVADIVINKPSETIRLYKVNTGRIQPLSSIASLPEVYLSALTNNTYPATCSLMHNYVSTYDMKSFHLPHETPECTYVLSTHCIEHKKFAVLIKYNPKQPGTKEIHFYVGKDHIVLVPGSRSHYNIRYNEEEKQVAPLAPLMLSDSSLITALVNIAYDGSSFIEINARKAGVIVRYDGTSVKVQIHPRYKGEMCGLCSEFNGEIVREYRGVDRCLYTSAEDFAKSSIVGTCTDKTPTHPYMCNNEEVTFSERSHDRYMPTTKRNVVLNHGDLICFSTKPVPVCENSATPSMTESHECKFHCLPKQDSNARRMVTESKRRILGEVETKDVDYTQTIQVAKMC